MPMPNASKKNTGSEKAKSRKSLTIALSHIIWCWWRRTGATPSAPAHLHDRSSAV